MRKNALFIFSLSLVIISVFSCKTDVDLRGPYEDTPIVFGLLDQSVDTQYIKINKSFIGEGNNFSYASIQDCTIYKNLTATITEKNSGTIYELKSKSIRNIQDGIFYPDSQQIYYFVPTTPLDETSKYILDVKVNEGLSNSKNITAETDIVKQININTKSLLEEIKFIEDDSPLKYGQTSVKFNAPYREMLFSVSFTFFYDEVLLDNSIQQKSLVYDLGTQTSRIDDEELEFILTGESFFNKISSNSEISQSTNNISKRVVRYFSYTIYAANKEYTTYISLNKPSTSISQDAPKYTNIEGGLGLFASRYTVIRDKSGLGNKDMRLSKLTLQHLFELNLKFCTDDTRYSTSSNSGGPERFYCP